MTKEKEYAFVLDEEGKQLSPTEVIKAWYLIRKQKAKLISKYPMTIQLNRVVNKEQIDKSKMVCGIDDGGLHVGLAIVQQCP